MRSFVESLLHGWERYCHPSETVEPQGIYDSHKCNHHEATCTTQENPCGAQPPAQLLPVSSMTKSFKVSSEKTSSFHTLYKLPSLASHSSFQSSLLQKHSVVFILFPHPKVISSFPPCLSLPWYPSLSFPAVRSPSSLLLWSSAAALPLTPGFACSVMHISLSPASQVLAIPPCHAALCSEMSTPPVSTPVSSTFASKPSHGSKYGSLTSLVPCYQMLTRWQFSSYQHILQCTLC